MFALDADDVDNCQLCNPSIIMKIQASTVRHKNWASACSSQGMCLVKREFVVRWLVEFELVVKDKNEDETVQEAINLIADALGSFCVNAQINSSHAGNDITILKPE